jgi:hypothetical protein
VPAQIGRSARVHGQGVPVEIRMESWLPSDTIRRMGFGHVVAARQHTLIVERGVSFVAFDDAAQPRTAYASNIYAPQPRISRYGPRSRSELKATDRSMSRLRVDVCRSAVSALAGRAC